MLPNLDSRDNHEKLALAVISFFISISLIISCIKINNLLHEIGKNYGRKLTPKSIVQIYVVSKCKSLVKNLLFYH